MKPVNQTYIAISSCCIFLFTFIFYLAYIMVPTYQTQLGFESSYNLTETQQNIAQDKIMIGITHIPKWIGSLVILSIIISVIILIKKIFGITLPSGITGFILSIFVIAIILSIGLITLGQLKTEVGVDNVVTNLAANNVIVSQLGTIPNWIALMITVALAFMILGYFYNMGAY